MRDEDQQRLIAALYEVPLGGGWLAPLQAVGQALEAGNAHLMAWDLGQPKPSYSLAPGMDERLEADYAAHYGSIDPRRLLVAELPQGQWFACHHRFGARTVERSEFWQDYLIPGGCRYLLGTRLARHDATDVFVGLHRAPDQQPFDNDDIALMRQLTPHLQRASRLWLQTEALRRQAGDRASALDAVEQPLLVIDLDGRVRDANRYAQALLRAGAALAIQHGRLTARRADDAATLAAAMQTAAASGAAAALRIDGRAIHLLRVPASNVLGIADGPARLIVLVTEPGHRRGPTALQLVQLFGLTPAEARLARALARGDTLEAYAMDAELALATVKTQLAALFRKTGTRRQPSLVRLLALLPSARPLHPKG